MLGRTNRDITRQITIKPPFDGAFNMGRNNGFGPADGMGLRAGDNTDLFMYKSARTAVHKCMRLYETARMRRLHVPYGAVLLAHRRLRAPNLLSTRTYALKHELILSSQQRLRRGADT